MKVSLLQTSDHPISISNHYVGGLWKCYCCGGARRSLPYCDVSNHTARTLRKMAPHYAVILHKPLQQLVSQRSLYLPATYSTPCDYIRLTGTMLRFESAVCRVVPLNLQIEMSFSTVVVSSVNGTPLCSVKPKS